MSIYILYYPTTFRRKTLYFELLTSANCFFKALISSDKLQKIDDFFNIFKTSWFKLQIKNILTALLNIFKHYMIKVFADQSV